jgi:predicted component of type VI protein secretion system
VERGYPPEFVIDRITTLRLNGWTFFIYPDLHGSKRRMRFCLRIITGKQAGREITISGSRFLIGCADNCDLKIHEIQVSPYHCALLTQKDDIWLRDYGCGTVVDGKRIVGRRRLNHCDQLQVGSLQFEMLIEDEPEKVSDRVADEGEILDILSQPIGSSRSELPNFPPGTDIQLADISESADTSDAAGDILDQLYMPKVSFKATGHASAIAAPSTLPTSPPEDDVAAPLSVDATETVFAPKRRMTALPRWLLDADGKLNPNAMFVLGVCTGIGICSAAVAFLWITGG